MPSAAERAYLDIRERLLGGNFEAGERLREERLSELLGVSRTPIREALRRLAAEGLVEFSPHQGAQVASWTDEELEEIFELRALLEGYAARRSATRMPEENIARLEEFASAMDDLVDDDDPLSLDKVAALNNDFHQLIVREAGSGRLSSFVRQVVHVPLVHRTFHRYTDRDLLRSFAHHRELIDAIRGRDPAWAESVMRSHVLAARRTLFLANHEGGG